MTVTKRYLMQMKKVWKNVRSLLYSFLIIGLTTNFDDYYAVPSDAYSVYARYYANSTNSYSNKIDNFDIIFTSYGYNYPVYTLMVFSNVNVKGYINLKLAELNFKDRSPQTAYQLFFMPVSGDEKKLYQEHNLISFMTSSKTRVSYQLMLQQINKKLHWPI